MDRLTLTWVEAGQVKTQTVQAQHLTKRLTKYPGAFRIGRDATQCDLVIQHPTVSKLHVEIFFVPQQPGFYLRNLRSTNPPLVDRQPLTQGIAELRQGCQIRLGELDITVQAVQVAAKVPPTVVSVPPVRSPQPSPVVPPVNLSYGLRCPKCQRLAPYDRLEVGCAWCGTSLASAPSELLVPES
jgi:predicted component of type VI protein secretion system